MGAPGFAALLKRSRTDRRLSQEQLAFTANTSTRHLSYPETGKSNPSRDMVLMLATALGLQLRDRNALLTSAGFAPLYSANALESLELSAVNRAVELLMKQQEPYGSILVDRCWNVLRMNEGGLQMLSRFIDFSNVAPHIAGNLVRASLHPDGLRPAIVNWPEVAAITLERLERECAVHPHDEQRHTLREEIRSYPDVADIVPMTAPSGGPVANIHLRRGDNEARLFMMLTTIGTPLDVTAQDLALETFFPADEATETWFRSLAI